MEDALLRWLPMRKFSGMRSISEGFIIMKKDGSYVTGTLRGNKADAESLGQGTGRNSSEKRRKQMKTGKVWLVGAGPGDIGLFYIKRPQSAGTGRCGRL